MEILYLDSSTYLQTLCTCVRLFYRTRRRTACLKYLVIANMLMKSAINPFDSQEAKPYRLDPEILAMTNLVTCAPVPVPILLPIPNSNRTATFTHWPRPCPPIRYAHTHTSARCCLPPPPTSAPNSTATSTSTSSASASPVRLALTHTHTSALVSSSLCATLVIRTVHVRVSIQYCTVYMY